MSISSSILSEIEASHRIISSFRCAQKQNPKWILIADNDHRCDNILRANSSLISRMYRKGDLVLVERPADQLIDQKKDRFVKDIKVEVQVKGWDDPGANRLMEEAKVKLLEPFKVVCIFDPNKDKESKCKAFTLLRNYLPEIKNLLDLFEKSTTHDKHRHYRHLVAERIKQYIRELSYLQSTSRQLSLITALEENRHRRIFLIAGRSHLTLEGKNPDKVDVDCVRILTKRILEIGIPTLIIEPKV